MKTKVELNKTYRTRNGCTAIITSLDGGEGMRPVTATVHGDGSPHTRNYTEFGFEHQPIGNEPQEECPFDLVEEIAG